MTYTTKGGKRHRESTKETSKKRAQVRWTRLHASMLEGTYDPESERQSVIDVPLFEAINKGLANIDERQALLELRNTAHEQQIQNPRAGGDDRPWEGEELRQFEATRIDHRNA